MFVRREKANMTGDPEVDCVGMPPARQATVTMDWKEKGGDFCGTTASYNITKINSPFYV